MNSNGLIFPSCTCFIYFKQGSPFLPKKQVILFFRFCNDSPDKEAPFLILVFNLFKFIPQNLEYFGSESNLTLSGKSSANFSPNCWSSIFKLSINSRGFIIYLLNFFVFISNNCYRFMISFKNNLILKSIYNDKKIRIK